MTNVQALASEWAAEVITAVCNFTEQGAAGTYTASVPLPPNSQLLDVRWANRELWGAGTSATLDCGDESDASLFMDGVDVKTVPAKGESIGIAQGIGTMDPTSASPGYYPNGGVVTATVVTVGTDASVGRSTLMVRYVVMPVIMPDAAYEVTE